MAVPIESERRQATILFADISGFTSMSEKLDPEEVTAIIGECFDLLGAIVSEYGGVIDKFIGDCVMALFGVPKALEGAPQMAITAALKMRRDLAAFNDKRNLAIPLGIHVGINSGEVLYGEVGSADRKDFTVMGDAVNLASRLKDLSEKGQIVVGPLTWRNARGAFRFVPLKPVTLKGKADQVQAYEVAGALACAEESGAERMIQSALVGRDEELKKLQLQVMKLVNGEGSVVNLIGEAGIGKSRLCAELYSKEFMKWVTVLEGRALAVGRTLSHYPIIGILKSWASICEEDAEEKAFFKLEAAVRAVIPEQADDIVPYIATLMGYRLTGRFAASLEGVLGESLGKMISKHLKDLIAKASAFKPILFVLEDLHWADESTLELLRSIIALSARHPIMFLCAWRPGYEETTGKLHGFLAETYPDRFIDIELSPLEEGRSEELVKNLLRNSGMPEQVIGRIVAKAGGNPFFIEEVIRSFIDRGLVKTGPGAPTASADIDSIEIPNSIDAVIMSRVDRLEEGMKELLRIASVIGRSFFHRILYGVAEASEGFGGCIESLKERQLIRERTRIGEIEYLFKHILVQETIYGSILIRSRKQLHLRVARTIEESFPERLPEFYGVLAFHYSKGEELDKAGEYLEKAGKAALESAASSEALIFYQEALAIYMQKKGNGAANSRLALFERNIARAFQNKGLMHKATEHYDAALQHLGVRRKKTWRKVIEAGFGFLSIVKYLYLPFSRSKKEPTEVEREIIETMVDRGWAVNNVNSTEFFLSGFITARHLLKRNLLSHPSGMAMLCNISQLLSVSGISFTLVKKILDTIETDLESDLVRYHFKDAEEYFCLFSGMRICRFDEKLIDFFVRQGDFPRVDLHLAFWGIGFLCLGSFAEAEDVARKLQKIAEAYDSEGSLVKYHEICTHIGIGKRSVQGTLQHADAAIALTKKKGDRTILKLYLSSKADALIQSGEISAAAEIIDEIPPLIREEKFLLALQVLPPLKSMLSFHIHSYNLTQDSGKRKAIVRKTLPILKQIRKYGPKFMFEYPEALRLAGTFHWLAGKQRTALQHWVKGLAIANKLGLRPEIGRISFEAARRLASQESRFQTLGQLGVDHYAKTARDTFTEIGLDVDLQELDSWEKTRRRLNDT